MLPYFHSLNSQRPSNMKKNIIGSMLVLSFAAMCVNGASVSKMEAEPEHGANATELEVKDQPNEELEVKDQPNVTQPQSNVTTVEVKRQSRFFGLFNTCREICPAVNFGAVACRLSLFSPPVTCNRLAAAGIIALLGAAVIAG